MKRRALAVAVGALFVAPAAHAQITFGNEQLGTLQIYGKLYPQLGWSSSSSATQPGTTVSNLVSTSPTNFACPAANCPGTNVQPRTTIDVWMCRSGPLRGRHASSRARAPGTHHWSLRGL